MVAKDNTVAISDRDWQIEKNRFRNSLASCTVTIHQHLDGAVSIRHGPHVVGRYDADGKPRETPCKRKRDGGGKDGTVEAMENRKTDFHSSHRSLEIPRRDSTTGMNTTKAGFCTARTSLLRAFTFRLAPIAFLNTQDAIRLHARRPKCDSSQA